MVNKSQETTIPLLLALLPLLFLIIMLAGSVTMFGDNSSYGPNQIALMLAAGVASIIGLYLGYTWKELETAMVQGPRCSSEWSLHLDRALAGPRTERYR